MIKISEPVSQALSWLLLVGLAFYAADATAAVIDDRLRVPPKQLPAVSVGQVQTNVTAQQPPPGMAALLATTMPDAPQGGPAVISRPGQNPSVTAATPSAPPSSLKLRGTMAGVGGAGLAMIDVNGQTQVISVGEQIGGMVLAEVSSYTARLEGGGRSQLLEMDVVTDLVAVTTLPPQTADPNANAVVPSPSPTPEAEDGEEASAASAGAILSQKELRNILDNPSEFAGKGFRMKPVLREGEIVGMRVSLKDGNHPLARLGVQDGDIVKSLNGTALNGPESLTSIYRVLRNTSSLRFEVERNGSDQAIDVALSE